MGQGLREGKGQGGEKCWAGQGWGWVGWGLSQGPPLPKPNLSSPSPLPASGHLFALSSSLVITSPPYQPSLPL